MPYDYNTATSNFDIQTLIQKSKIKNQNEKSKFKKDFVKRGLFAFESFILIFAF
jgi:hypothetical protein